MDRRILRGFAGWVAPGLLAAVCLAAAPPQSVLENAPTFAAGRVIFCVAHNAIIVAAAGGRSADMLPPSVIPLSSERIGVLLGAVKWTGADPGAKVVRLDSALPNIAESSTRHVSNENADEPSDIEGIGIGLLDALRDQVSQIHHKLDLPAGQPIAELLLADYVEDYGPEIWSLQYRIRQQDFGNDYWQTTLLRPAYYQLYPPEKPNRSILAEAQYPPSAGGQATLADRLEGGDPQLDAIRNSQDFIAVVAAIQASDSKKTPPDQAADFLRTALPVMEGSQAKLAVAELDAVKGFQWVLPPEQPIPAPPAQPSQGKPTDNGAPSLRKYIPPDR